MRARGLLLGLTIALFCGMPAFGQDTAGMEQGLKPYGAFHGGDIDSVSMVNMKLNLHIPLVSYPQRGGKLHVGFYVSYWNQIFTPNLDCTTNKPPVCTGDFLVDYTGQNYPYKIKQLTSIQITPDVDPTAGCPPPGFPQRCSIWDPDGAVHQMGETSSTGRISMDATGYIFDNSAGVLTDREGTRYTMGATGQGGRFEDTNGNFTTKAYDSNQLQTLTDTLGRTIPYPWPTGPSTSTTDFSHCTGSLTTTGAVLWTVPSLNGGTETFKICNATITLDPNVFCGTLCPEPGRTREVIQSIVLPNNTAWTFVYDNNGVDDLTQIIFPTGGSITYTWGNYITCLPPDHRFNTTARAILTRTVNANDGTGPHQWTYSQTAIANGLQTTVTDPLGNVTVHTQANLGGVCTYNETETDRYNGAVSPANLLEKTVTDYNFSTNPYGQVAQGPYNTVINVIPIRVTTTLGNGQTKKIEKDYDAGIAMTDIGAGTNALYGDVKVQREYAYGSGSPGALVRTTTTNYQAFGNSSYLANNLLTLPSSVVVTDSGGTTRANSTYGYDEGSRASSGISTQHDSSPPAGNFRGNQTSIHRQLLNGSAVSTSNCPVSVSAGGYLVSSITFFDTGTPDVATDPCGHVTTLASSTTYAGAYPTSVTNAKNQIMTHTYDFNTGQRTSVTDPNNQPTNYTYDVMWRLASVTYPDGGSDVYAHQETTFPFSATLTRKITSSQNQVTTNVFDGLGRVSQSQLADPQGMVYTATTYDADGRVATVSNPYRSISDPTYGFTTNQYDALARLTQVTKPDGSFVKTAYCGSTTLVTDEAGHWRRSTTDALGRLIEVDEPNSPTATVNSNGCPGTGEPIWVTTYSYDTLDNLVSVTQGGSHGRSFVYDSMKRLTSSTNPETGTTPVTYGYDADGNVITKTDARSITITYTYELLHRLTGRTYSNGDPAVTYTYDQVQSGFFNIGRRTSMTDAGGSETLNYDKMGRELAHQRVTNSITKSTSYTYNLDGSLATLTYPSGRTITYTPDSAGRPSVAKDVANSVNYVTGTCANGAAGNGACYAPSGALAQLQNGANLVTTYIYNQRFQPCWIYATTGTALAASTLCTGTDSTPGNILDMKYSFNVGASDNGNVIGITNNRDTTRSQTFAYDQVNRIATGGTNSGCGANCWSLGFTYDQWANLTTAAATGSATPLTLSVNSNNRITTSGFTYDASGNLTADVTSGYVWNAESEIKTAAGVNYTYDGDGNRVQKSNGKIYWYGAGTEILDESDASGNFTDEYVFFGGKRVAHRSVSSGNIFYYTEDMLGSSRAILQSGQTSVCYDADFYPYGGEKVYANTCPQNYKFEGKERDAESGNDDFGARYYSSVYGRWLSPDWSSIPAPVPYANLANPQTLNLYAMVADNPETFADLDGHAVNCADDPGVVGCDGKPKDTQQPPNSGNPENKTVQAGAAAPAIPALLQGLSGLSIPSWVPLLGGWSLLAGPPIAGMALAANLPPMPDQSNLMLDALTPTFQPAPPMAPPMASQNTNPYVGPVSTPVTVVDPKGNAIPVQPGQQIQGSKDGRWVQVKDANGQPTGTRIDGGHPASTHPDPRAQVPHAHVPGHTNSDGTPWLPVTW
jgi:RHS repeat-associated protein